MTTCPYSLGSWYSLCQKCQFRLFSVLFYGFLGIQTPIQSIV